MANSDEFFQKAIGALSSLGDISTRSMFGGHGLFLDGKMFALISNDVLILQSGR